MRSKAQKVSDRRLCATTLSILAVFILALFTGCTLRLDVPEIEAQFVRITIKNNRVSDAIDPTFYLTGTGRHSLGVVRGMGGKVSRFVDTRWFDGSNCMTISAHYAGLGNLTFEKFCWSQGYVIDVSLEELFSPIAAWAHR